MLDVSKIKRECADQAGDPTKFIGCVRIQDLAEKSGLAEIDFLAVFFDAGAHTRPHTHPTPQLLYFVSGAGFVAFVGEEEQLVPEGGVVVIPACELHMHGATASEPVCHVAVKLSGGTNWQPKLPPQWREFAHLPC